MADNVALNSMTGGDNVAADDINGIKFQRVKLIHGVDGTNDGDIASTNPLPVVVSGGTLVVNTISTVAISGTVTVNTVSSVVVNTISTTLLATAAKQLADGHFVVLSGGTTTVNTISSVSITGAVTVNTISGVNITNTVGTVSLTAANFNVTEASAADMKTALQIMDDWDVSDHINIRHLVGADDQVVVSNGSIGILGSLGVVSLTAANFNVVVSGGTLTVNTNATATISGTMSCVSPTASNFNVVVSNGTLVVNTASTLATSPTAANFNVVVSNGTLTVNTISTTAVTQATAASLNCVVSNGTIVVNTISTTLLSTAAKQLPDGHSIVISGGNLATRTTRFKGVLTTTNCTTAQTVVTGTGTNSNLHITSYLISVLGAGTYWLEDGSANALTPYIFLAANGGVSYTATEGTPLSTIVTSTTIKIKGSAAG